MKLRLLLSLGALLCLHCNSTQTRIHDIVIIGGGTSGTAAAIQAGRMGADVLLLQETEWLGGMLSAAGVSATDGNHKLPAGLWGEFRDSLYARYGGPDALFTGWVSNTQFEPHVGAQIFEHMIEELPNVQRMVGFRLKSATLVPLENGKKELKSILVESANGANIEISANVFIEATEYGDVLAITNTPYSHYMETKEETGEQSAPESAHPYVQDLTYVAILEDYSPKQAPLVERPSSYTPEEFDCMCLELCSDPSQTPVSCDKMLDYGRLPNDKFMINWPNFGNDHYADLLEKPESERSAVLQDAKNTTLSWIYHLQTEGNYTHIGLARDEFPTEDGLALIPYIRESRRVEGIDRLYEYDLADPYALTERPLYQSAIAVGDYPLDHHRKKNPVAKQIDFPSIPSYSVPYGVMIPKSVNGLIVAEKSISVSNVANGTTRLQPVVLQLGQAAGLAAVLSADIGVAPALLDVRSLQEELLDYGAILMPYMDALHDHWAFSSIQKVGLSGIMRGEGIPVAWANETRFHPEKNLSSEELEVILNRAKELEYLSENTQWNIGNRTRFTVGQALEVFAGLAGAEGYSDSLVRAKQSSAEERLKSVEIGLNTALNRATLAYLLDHYFDPFYSKTITIGYPNSKL
jgi:hypothetical protein